MARKNPNAALMLAVQCATKGGPMPLIKGYPGISKTAVQIALAKVMNRKLIILLGSCMDTTDMGGLPWIINANRPVDAKVSATDYSNMEFVRMVPREFVKICWQEPTWICFDEFSNVSPAVSATLLTTIQDRRIGEYELPDHTIFTAIMNPVDVATNGYELSPAMANRVFHYNYVLDRKAVIRGFQNGLRFPAPEVEVLPADWERYIDPIASMIGTFFEVRPNLMEAFPTERNKQSEAYPTPRSWDYAARLMAASQSINASREVEMQLVSGVVGEPAALEYFEYIDHLDIPNIEELLSSIIESKKNGTQWDYKHPDRNDKVLAMLSQLCCHVVSDPSHERWYAAMDFLMRLSEMPNCMETVLGGSAPLIRAMPKGCEMPPDFINKVWPKIKRAVYGS